MKQRTGWLGVVLVVALAISSGSSVGRGGRSPAGLEVGGWRVSLEGQWGGASRAAAVRGGYAYVGEGARLTVVDITDPAQLLIVGKTAVMPAVVQGVSLAGEYAYVADAGAGLRVVDVSDPTQPIEVGYYDTRLLQ
jgi:hypothetical protein